MNRQIIAVVFVFIVSRIIFINTLPIFFDSPEYLERFSNPNYFQAIVSGHMPSHAGYIILFWPIFHIASFLHINPSFAIIFAQIIFSAIAMYCFYRFIEMLTNKKIALITTIISIFTPLYWVINVSIMAESTYIIFFLLSLFFQAILVKKRLYSNLYILLSCIFFGFAFLTHPLIILWLPFLLSIIYFFKKEKIILFFPVIITTVILVVATNGFFVSHAFHIPFQNGAHTYLFSEDMNVLPNISSPLTILRFIRQAFTPILQNNTAIVLILSFISLIGLFKNNKKLFIIAFLWISPAIITNQWFDPLLLGRHGTTAGLGLAFLTAIFLNKRKILFFIVIVYLLTVSLPALSLLKQPIPYFEEQKFIQSLPKGLLIESHYARPQIEGHYRGKIIFINEVGWNKEELKTTIDNYITTKKPVFITSQALSEPYGLYSGPFLHPLSLSYLRKFDLNDVIILYSVSKYVTIDQDAGLFIYKIISKERSEYPDIPKLNYNRRRIDYFDTISRLEFFIERAKIIQIHNIIKE